MKICELCGKEDTYEDQDEEEIILGICEECIKNGPFYHANNE